MKPHIFKSIILTFLSAAFLLIPSAGFAEKVQLSVELAKPYLIENQSQKTFLKVGLTGYELQQGSKRAPVNIAIVLDQSGSMRGEKIYRAKQAALQAVERLGSDDILSVLAYSNTVRTLLPATKLSHKQQVKTAIESIRANGSTALFAGVSKGGQELRKFLNKNRVNRIILLSDGIANIGPDSPSELGALGVSLAKEGISVTTIGLGLGYNEDLMTQLALNSDGNHAFVQHPSDLAEIFDAEFGDVLSVVAQDVQIDIQCNEGIKPLRVVGRSADIIGQKVTLSMNQLYSKQEKYVLLEVEVPARSQGHELRVAEVEISYNNMSTKSKDRIAGRAGVQFVKTKGVVEKNINKKVMVDAVEQIAAEENKKALKLRDQGKIKEAKNALIGNSLYLKEAAKKYAAPKLESFGAENEEEADNLEGPKWKATRKAMKKKQYSREVQQSY